MKNDRTPEFYEKIVALKGKLTASEIGERFGITKNAVIGIWNRAGAPALKVQERSELQSSANRAAWERRRLGL